MVNLKTSSFHLFIKTDNSVERKASTLTRILIMYTCTYIKKEFLRKRNRITTYVEIKVLECQRRHSQATVDQNGENRIAMMMTMIMILKSV